MATYRRTSGAFAEKRGLALYWCLFDFGHIDLLVTVTAADKSVARFMRSFFLLRLLSHRFSNHNHNRGTLPFGLHSPNNFVLICPEHLDKIHFSNYFFNKKCENIKM